MPSLKKIPTLQPLPASPGTTTAVRWATLARTVSGGPLQPIVLRVSTASTTAATTAATGASATTTSTAGIQLGVLGLLRLAPSCPPPEKSAPSPGLATVTPGESHSQAKLIAPKKVALGPPLCSSGSGYP